MIIKNVTGLVSMMSQEKVWVHTKVLVEYIAMEKSLKVTLILSKCKSWRRINLMVFIENYSLVTRTLSTLKDNLNFMIHILIIVF